MFTRRSDIITAVLKDPEYSLEGLMLKLQYFGHLMWRADSLEKILILGKIEGRRRSRRQDEMVGWLSSTQWTWIWANSGRKLRTGKLGVLESMGSQRVVHDWVTEQLLLWRNYFSNDIFNVFQRKSLTWVINKESSE